MAKLLRLTDWILLGAAATGELFENIRLVGDIVPGIMGSTYGFVPPRFRKKSYYEGVSKLLKTNKIKKSIDKEGNVSLELTNSGARNLTRRFPIFMKRSWDGSFMIVVFDIPEKDRKSRDNFRIKLKELGFGKLQESVWVSPYHFEDDLREFLEEKGYMDYVFVMKASRVLGINLKDKAEEIWKLNAINKQYEDLIITIGKILNGDSYSKEAMKEVWDSYFEVLTLDPMLPDDLLPMSWKRDGVKKLLEKLINIA